MYGSVGYDEYVWMIELGKWKLHTILHLTWYVVKTQYSNIHKVKQSHYIHAKQSVVNTVHSLHKLAVIEDDFTTLNLYSCLVTTQWEYNQTLYNTRKKLSLLLKVVLNKMRIQFLFYRFTSPIWSPNKFEPIRSNARQVVSIQ